MQKKFDRCSETHREEALSELRAELADFSHDGLVQLCEDLSAGKVARGSWTGCVISYKRGAAGSSRRDRMGRARNAFTILWDNGWLTDEEVLDAARSELRRRSVESPECTPSAVDHAAKFC
ncbi:MAG: hypothetical protein ACT443_06355 [Gemmatimonadota bacterium]